MNPPKPPQGGAEESPADRARKGSRRQRDVDALAVEAAARNVELLSAPASPEASAAFDEALVLLRAAFPKAPGIGLFVERLRVVGALDEALVLAGDHRIVSWVRRRHAAALGEAVRKVSDYRGVYLATCEPDNGDELL